MASSLLALIDDIASVLDDVAVLSKLAAKKTAGPEPTRTEASRIESDEPSPSTSSTP